MTQVVQGTPVPAVFNFQSHQVRTVIRDDAIWFVASDVCAALGYQNTSKAVGDHLDADERSIALVPRTPNDSLGVKTNTINESGLYALVLRSRKPEARKFAKWVTSEVLPSIRKTGSYGTPTFDVRTTLTETGSTPTLALPADLQHHLNQKAITLALEAYELLSEHLKRQVAYNCEHGVPRTLLLNKARSIIDSCNLGAALAGKHMEALSGVRFNAQIHLNRVQDLLDALPAKGRLS